MRFLLAAVGVAALLIVLHLLAVYAESRGWIYYRVRPPRVRMLGLLEELVEPEIQYMIEEQSSEAIRADQDESGQGLA